MAIEPEEVKKIAYLARIQVNEESAAKLTHDLSQILDFVDQMKSVDTATIEPLSNPLEMSQPLRTDWVTETDQREALQAIAPAIENGLFLVPRVIE